MSGAEELEWSEEEDPDRYIMRTPKRATFNLEREVEGAEEGSGLQEHKRSTIFSGAISLSSPSIDSRQGSSSNKDVSPFETLLKLLKNLQTSSNLILVETLLKERSISVLFTVFESFNEEKWRLALSGFEVDDFIELPQVLSMLEGRFGKARLISQSRTEPLKTISMPVCAHPSCIQSRAISGCACFYTEQTSGREDDDDESLGLSKAEAFRLEVIYQRLVLELGGKVRVRHMVSILTEMGIPYDKHKLPKSFWSYRGEMILTSTQELKQLVAKVRISAMDAPDPLAHLFKYKLPSWLREEFKTSEILLYQHHFTMIDKDEGGSIDVYELQHLFNSLGSKISLDQAQALLDEYDLDGGGTIDFVEFMVLIYKVQRGTINLDNSGLVHVLNEAKAQLKIFEEIEEVSLHPPALCSVVSFGGSPVECEVAVQGPPQSPYEDIPLRVRIIFNEGYPYVAPDVQVLSRIVAVNVMMQLTGIGRFMHLYDVWAPDWSIARLLVHVVEVLSAPQLALLPDPFRRIAEHWEAEVQRIADERLAALEKKREEWIAAAEAAATTAEETAATKAATVVLTGAGAESKDGHTQKAVAACPSAPFPPAAESSPRPPKEAPTDAQAVLPRATMSEDSSPTGFVGANSVEEAGVGALKTQIPPISLEMITPQDLQRQILVLSRVEQMHLSVLFLFSTDKTAFFTYAREVTRRYSPTS